MMNEAAVPEVDVMAWKAALAQDLSQELRRGRWSRALAAIAWVHLAFFLACQAIYDRQVDRDYRFLAIWGLELLAVLGVFRWLIGPGWAKTSPAISVVVRLWATFLILSFNLVTLNNLTGWSVHWYKPAWATLSSFLFAGMAWLFTPRFLWMAVLMYFTGLLMTQVPHWGYVVYGFSWWLALLLMAGQTARLERLGPIEV